MILCDGDGDEEMLILSITHGNGVGMEIAFVGTDGDGHRVQWGRLGTYLYFMGTDGDGDKCSSPRRALARTGQMLDSLQVGMTMRDGLIE